MARASSPKLTSAERRYETHQRRRLAALRSFIARFGWTPLRAGRRAGLKAGGSDLSRWVVDCRHRFKRGDLPAWVAAELSTIPGWTWEGRATSHDRFICLLHALVEGVADASRSVPSELVTIALLVDDCRAKRRRGSLSEDLAASLERLPGWSWGAASLRDER